MPLRYHRLETGTSICGAEYMRASIEEKSWIESSKLLRDAVQKSPHFEPLATSLGVANSSEEVEPMRIAADQCPGL